MHLKWLPSIERLGESVGHHDECGEVEAESAVAAVDLDVLARLGVVIEAVSPAHDTDTSENVEVYGSHCGLGFNLAALIVVADRLAQPLDRWQPFQVHRSLRGLFPAAPTFRVPAEHASG